MIETVTGVLSAIKGATPVVLLGIAIATGVGLFAGDRFMSTVGLFELRGQYRPYIGGTFLLASSLLVAQGVAGAWRMIESQIDRRRKKRRDEQALARLNASLRSLTPDEKAFLAPFILGAENSLYFRIEDGIAGGLVAKNILFRPSNIGSPLGVFAHNIQPWARDYLTEHPELLEGATLVPNDGPPQW